MRTVDPNVLLVPRFNDGFNDDYLLGTNTLATCISTKLGSSLRYRVPEVFRSDVVITTLMHTVYVIKDWIISGRVELRFDENHISLRDMDNERVMVEGEPVKLLYSLQRLRLFGYRFHLESTNPPERLKSIGDFIVEFEKTTAKAFGLTIAPQEYDGLRVLVGMSGNAHGRFVVDMLLEHMPVEPEIIQAMANGSIYDSEYDSVRDVKVTRVLLEAFPSIQSNMRNYLVECRRLNQPVMDALRNKKYILGILSGEIELLKERKI